MSYTMYTPLNVWLDPASVTDVVAYIQNYLSENTIYSEEEIEELIHDYLIAHPELIGGVQSVNGKTGTVVLSASDINTANNVTIESVLTSLSSQISSIAASVATNTSNITALTGRMTTAETDLSNLKSSIDSDADYNVTNLGDGYINGTNGNIQNPTSDVQKYTIDYFPVQLNSVVKATLVLSQSKYRSIGVMGYDENKAFLGRLAIIDGGVNSTIILETTINRNDAKYVRYSFSTFDVFVSLNVSVENKNTVVGRLNTIYDLEDIRYQYINSANWELGYYNWNQSQTALIKNSSQTWYCNKITDIPAGTYHYNKFCSLVFSFIENKSTGTISKLADIGITETVNGEITINYDFNLWLSLNSAYFDKSTAMFSSGNLPTVYTYGYYKDVSGSNYVNAQGQTVWIVGEGYIPTIQAACDAASANDIIFIRCGTYTEQVSIWNKKLHLIGENKANTILIDHSGFYNTPPLEMSLGSLSNMTIIEDGSNPTGSSGDSGYMGAYCLHIEWEPSQTGEEFIIDNCDFINDIHAPLGCGLYQDYTVHFKNCSFRCNATAEGNMERGAFYFHTRSAENCTGQKMIVENCIISSAGTKWAVLCGVPSTANNTGSATVRFSGCTVWNDNDGVANSVVYFDLPGGANVLSLVNSYGNTVSALNS